VSVPVSAVPSTLIVYLTSAGTKKSGDSAVRCSSG
jgi:hypothetical protein